MFARAIRKLAKPLPRYAFNVQAAPIKTNPNVQPLENVKADLLISNSCVDRLKKISNTPDDFLRVTVEGGGCSGFQYKFDLDSGVQEDDRVFEKDGVKVVVDSISLDYIKGATIDYQEELIRSAFKVVGNPLAEKGCSCGASFAVRLD
ncbi:unnamed protein product [Phaedon cochleariae]|uniref:Iron-sulfur cluster assembly 2 homolog, mitochondrial n=1 Tax=Phaedon cochleariae TaxID=80249 RepID=A0A9P0D9T8_PHACE|nr:unnamed protein product [Phaedon cochleariae]